MMRKLFLATSAAAMLAALPVLAQNTMGGAPSPGTATGVPTTQQDRQTMGSSSSRSMRSDGQSMGSGSSTDTKHSGHGMSKNAGHHSAGKSSEASTTAQLNREEANRLQGLNR
jgi:hypothetical protein